MNDIQASRHRPHQFFVSPESIRRRTVMIDGPQAHQIVNVLRLGPGGRIVVLDNNGWQYDVEIVLARDEEVICTVKSKSLVTTEPRTKLTLYQGLLRPNKFEFVLQKGTELGVVAFVPVITERSLMGNIEEVTSAKMERWRKIIAEAAEQSGRGKLPALRPATTFQQACEEARGPSLIAWESVRGRSLRSALKDDALGLGKTESGRAGRPFTINLFVGPEGGFSHAEIQAARTYGMVGISLGTRILRAETAALVAATLTLYEAGDLQD